MTSTASSDSIFRRLWFTRFRDMLRGRFDASLDWRQVVAAAELPEELSSAVCQVVGKSRLWRGEKCAVAEELVSHFQEGLDRGASTAELRESFGVPAAAGTLIRRAKRRNRSLTWHVWHYGWISVLVLAALYIATGLWLSLGRATIRTDYLAELNKAPLAVPENERAWPVYRDALLAMGFGGDNKNDAVPSFLESEAKPGEPNWAAREKFLTENAGAIAKLREAAGRTALGFEGRVFPAKFSEADQKLFQFDLKPEQIEAAKHETIQDRWTMSTLLPDMQSLRRASEVLAADAQRAAAAGDGNTAYANIAAIISMGRQAEEMPFLVCILVSDAIQQRARTAVRDVLINHPELWTDKQLGDLAHKFASTHTNWQRGIDGETMGFKDSMQRLYTDNGSGDGRLAFRVNDQANIFQVIDMAIIGDAYQTSIFADSALAVLSMPAANAVVASRKQMIDMHDKVTNEVRSRIETPLWLQKNDESLDSELDALRHDMFAGHRYLFVRLLMPAYDKLRNTIIVSDGERDGVFTGLALEMYHRKNGKWPATLAELSPQWLPEVPVDRITGQPLRYKIVNDRPLVYGAGPDGDDDAGRAAPDSIEPRSADPTKAAADGDWVIWSAVKSEKAAGPST